MWHARRFDFLCDDAFIALRYARTWAETGAPVYNPGERVEGYTSFLFTAAVAALSRLGVPPPAAARALGALGALGLLAASLALLRALLGRRSWPASAALLALLALSAPVAAWSLGGLETSVFAALAVAALALGIRNFSTVATPGAADEIATPGAADEIATPGAADDAPRSLGGGSAEEARRWLAAGLVLGLATLARPEGALFLGGLGAASLGLALRERCGARGLASQERRGARGLASQERRGAWGLAALALGYGAVVAPFVAWRWGYYGHPLPNTFYVKATGDAGELWARGLRYGELAFHEMNPVLILAGVAGLLMPGASRSAAAGLWALRLVVASGVLYVLRVGGDFLDLYRFFVPFWPLLLVAALRPLAALELALRPRRGPTQAALVAGALGLLAALGHGVHQRAIGAKALQIAEPERAARHLEPLGWTREFALRWAALGRWLAETAGPGDTMAIGAAGAMPYFARIPNLDLFGLCDSYIAHHGLVIGTRPGHQRFAPHGYLLERNPTFLVLNAEAISFAPRPLGPDPRWNPLGWVWAEASTSPERHGHPRPLYLHFLLRRERASALRGAPGLRIAEDNPR